MIVTAALLVIVIGYADSDPYAWGDLFPSCHPLLETHHSPIDLHVHSSRRSALGELQLEGFDAAPPGPWTLQNDGHSVVLEVGRGMSVSGGGLPGLYHPIQLHFHWGSPSTNGSEHTVDGLRYPVEQHMGRYYRYHGSLTTPPCNQVVVWTLYQVPIHISWDQLQRLTSGIYASEEDEEEATPLHNNFRHTHPTYSRTD
ncbi:hypothetical protein CRUP_029315 [Coryphaenoides rupestris]|nr:hypothetical protein CRUP_029315 [Coryphaenoides rupestris]